MKGEIGMLAARVSEIILVEDLLLRPRAVPEADFAGGFLGLEKMGEMRAQRAPCRRRRRYRPSPFGSA